MAADTTLLQGEVVGKTEDQDRDVERLLAGFLRALIEEQKQNGAAIVAPSPVSEPWARKEPL